MKQYKEKDNNKFFGRYMNTVEVVEYCQGSVGEHMGLVNAQVTKMTKIPASADADK